MTAPTFFSAEQNETGTALIVWVHSESSRNIFPTCYLASNARELAESLDELYRPKRVRRYLVIRDELHTPIDEIPELDALPFVGSPSKGWDVLQTLTEAESAAISAHLEDPITAFGGVIEARELDKAQREKAIRADVISRLTNDHPF